MRKLLTFLAGLLVVGGVVAQEDYQRNVYIGGADSSTQVNVSNFTNGLAQQVNASGNAIGIDTATRVLTGITYEHHEVHAGSHYTVTLTDDDFDSGETNGIYISTVNNTKWAHMLFVADTSLAADAYIVENPTSVSTGAFITAYNNDRNSSNTAQTVFSSMTNLTGGTVIDAQLFGATGAGNFRGSGSAGGRGNEVILKQNEEYAIYMVSGAADCRMTIHLSFYEHTNKTD